MPELAAGISQVEIAVTVLVTGPVVEAQLATGPVGEVRVQVGNPVGAREPVAPVIVAVKVTTGPPVVLACWAVASRVGMAGCTTIGSEAEVAAL